MSAEPESDDTALPVNLHFRDERVLTVDIDSIMTSGLRMRRNKKVFAGTVAAVAIGALGVSAAYLNPASSPSARPVNGAASKSNPVQTRPGSAAAANGTLKTGFEQSTVVRDHPPTGGHITVLNSKFNPMGSFTISSVAWLSGGQICSGAADLTSTTGDSISCVSRPSALSATAPTVLAPHVVTGITDATGSQVAIGFAAGGVAKVSLKVGEHVYDAAVVSLPGSPATKAYMVWISGGDFGKAFTQITGYDSRGAVVAVGHP